MKCPVCKSELTFPTVKLEQGLVHAQCAVVARAITYPDPILDDPDNATDLCDCNKPECVYFRGGESNI